MRVIWNHFYPKKDSDYPPIVQEIDFSWPRSIEYLPINKCLACSLIEVRSIR